MAEAKAEQVLYTDEVPTLRKKGDGFLPDKKVSPLDSLGLDLEIRDTIGGGQFFKVKKAFSKKRNCMFAIKVLCKLKAPDVVKKEFFPREIKILKKLCHEHIVTVHEILLTNRKGIILMDYMPNGDLLEYINKQVQGHLCEAESRHLFHQLQSAVTYLHHQDIVHRDIKCSNILLDHEYKLKLTDFGFAAYCSDGQKLTEACGSMGYVAPEILEGEAYQGKPVDIWSMGVTLYAMLCGRLPYHEESLDVFLESINNPQEKLCFPTSVTKDCRDFVHALLTPQPHKRAKLCSLGKMNWLARPTPVKQPITDLPTMTSQIVDKSIDDCAPASSQLSLDTALKSCTNKRRQSVAFETDVEHGFSESQKDHEDMKATAVTDVLKAVAVRHAFGESPMSVHKNLDSSIGQGPHHFDKDTIGLKGPAARRISVQLSQTNMALNKTHVPHQQQQLQSAYQIHPMTTTGGRRASLAPRRASVAPRRASVAPRRASVAPRRMSLAPHKVCWKDEQNDMTPSRKGSLLMMMRPESAQLRRGSLALHHGKVNPGGSFINLSGVDLTTYSAQIQEKNFEDEKQHIHYSMAAKVAKKADSRRQSAAETTRRNSVFTEEMQHMQMPNSLKPEEQELVNSFRSQCETMKHLVA